MGSISGPFCCGGRDNTELVRECNSWLGKARGDEGTGTLGFLRGMRRNLEVLLRNGREDRPVSGVPSVDPDVTGEDGVEAIAEDVDALGERACT